MGYELEGTPNNESIEDSVLDLANYAVLLNMILEETKNEKLSTPSWDADGIDHNPKLTIDSNPNAFK